MVLFGFFSLVLVLVYWINRAVRLFDKLIADGQSAVVFFEFTALSLPTVIQIALPLAGFTAAVYVTNRMATESELTVVQATGYSPFRLARPVLFFGLIVGLLMSILTHSLVPMSIERLSLRQSELAQSVSARLLTEGQFMEPSNGVTLYIREITSAGELIDVFIADTRKPTSEITYTASQAFLVRDNATTQLVMIDGMIQTLQTQSQRLFTTRFDDFAFNIGGLTDEPSSSRRRNSHLSTSELLRPTPALITETRRTAPQLIASGHDRFNQALLATIAALLGFSSLMVGGFSRFGVWKQIIGAVILIVLVKGVESVGLNIAREDPRLWFASYLSSLVGAVIVVCLLFWSSRPYLFKRRIKDESAIL